MKPNIEELRKKYMAAPPEGMTSRDIRDMSEDELLDMDYFLNDDNLDDDHMFVFVHLKIEISYKEKNSVPSRNLDFTLFFTFPAGIEPTSDA